MLSEPVWPSRPHRLWSRTTAMPGDRSPETGYRLAGCCWGVVLWDCRSGGKWGETALAVGGMGGGQHLIQSPPSCGGDCSERGAAGQKLSAPGVRTELAVGGGSRDGKRCVSTPEHARNDQTGIGGGGDWQGGLLGGCCWGEQLTEGAGQPGTDRRNMCLWGGQQR